jgi:AmiR/NasT family two-component response regulator
VGTSNQRTAPRTTGGGRRPRRPDNATVAMAQGMLMERHALTPEEALALLRQCGEDTGSTLVQVATALVGTRRRP